MATKKRLPPPGAHTPQARAKAGATHAALAEARRQMAERYNAKPAEFMMGALLRTIERRHIPVEDIPPVLLKPFPKSERDRILRGRNSGNGQTAFGIPKTAFGIPLDAIPERAPKATPSRHDPYQHKRGHPNAELIGKILDLLASPQIEDRIAERLLAALDKLT